MKKLIVKILGIVIILMLVVNVSYAKFITKINVKGVAKLKVPILVLESNPLVVGEFNKEKNMYTQDFCLKNYFEKNQKTNEIQFQYFIKLIPSTSNFPANYKLINLDTNEEIKVNEKLETQKILMNTEKTIHRYRLIVNWGELNTKEEVDEILEVKIKVNAEQIEKGE